ncbi:hypothetical protein PSACC_00451, partial [Paramicrosporidium saccamoebae]
MTASRGLGHNGDFGENEKVLQAIVMADSFNERFMPITLDRPRCLLPLVNVPIIEYTFEFLAVSGVQEVILFCRAHADQIKQYLSRSRWSKPTSTMHIQIVVNNECTSVGDALRDIDGRSVIHGDFLLVCGDVVSNINLSQALQAHKQRRQVDRNFILTMVLKETSPFHRSRERCESGIFAIDSATGECLAYESVESENLQQVTLPLARLSTAKELSIRYDLMDCQIDICSVNVLALYTENFDYEDVRKDFLRGVLTSDILGVKIATHILTHEYAGRVRSPHLYESISMDIIERWVFPIVPEADLLEEQPYSYRRGNCYHGLDVVLSRSASVGNNVVLGNGVSVGENSIVRNSVIGANCQIGSDVVIENSFIWDNSCVENGCRIVHSIIADHVRVRCNTRISRGCLVTSNITLGPRADIPPSIRVAKLGEHVELSMRNLAIGESDDLASLTARQKFLGEESDGAVWGGAIDENEDSNSDNGLKEERRTAFEIGSIFHNSRPSFDDVLSEDDEDHDEQHDADPAAENSFGRNSVKFFHDSLDLMKHAIESNYVVDNALLEINGLKFACNATFSECRQVILQALFSFIEVAAIPKSVDKLFLKWAPLLSRFTQGVEEQVELINTVEKTCQTSEGLERSFQFIVPVLYKSDVLEDDAIITWYRNNEPSNSLFVRQIRSFVQWLEQDDEDEDSGSDSDSDS